MGNHATLIARLSFVSYYRLSAYWRLFRKPGPTAYAAFLETMHVDADESPTLSSSLHTPQEVRRSRRDALRDQPDAVPSTSTG
jgi:hypothetical protein